MSDESLQVVNFDDLAQKRRVMTFVGGLKGLHEVSIKPRKRTRTLNQNAYYFSAVVTPWRDWLRESYGDPSIDTEQAHEALKEAVLGRKVLTSPEGREIEVTHRTRGMKTDEFTNYVEGCIKFLAEFCGIVVLPSEMFYEERGKKR